MDATLNSATVANDEAAGVRAPLPSVAIGILNFNRAAETIDAITSALQVDYPPDRLTVILLDNASVDDSVDRVADTFGSRVEVVRLQQNLGPVARNRVMLTREEEYVIVLDEDCRLEDPSTVRRVVDFLASHREFGALCFACWNPYLRIFEYGHPGDHYRRRHPDGTYEGMYVIGGGMVFRTSAIAGIEGYDERLVWGGEEYDLGLELLRHDIAIAYRRDFALEHRQAPRAYTSVRTMEFDMRNNIWISLRRFPLPFGLLFAAIHIARRLLSAGLKRDRNRLRGYLRGIRSAMSRLPEFLSTRKPISYQQMWTNRKWIIQMFYAPRSYVAEHRQATRGREKGKGIREKGENPKGRGRRTEFKGEVE